MKSIFPRKEKQTQKEPPGRRFVLGTILFLCVLTGNRYSKQAKTNKQVTGTEMKPGPGNRAAGPLEESPACSDVGNRFWRIPFNGSSFVESVDFICCGTGCHGVTNGIPLLTQTS